MMYSQLIFKKDQKNSTMIDFFHETIFFTHADIQNDGKSYIVPLTIFMIFYYGFNKQDATKSVFIVKIFLSNKVNA